jgi:hypothetical protein
VTVSGGADAAAQDPFHLAGVREPLERLLGEDQLVAVADLEDASRAPDEGGLEPQTLLERRRQTGGAALVPSHSAVFDEDLGHDVILANLAAASGNAQ